MPRLILVSSRLPVCTVRRDGEVFLERSTGGLASRLASAHRRSRGVWVGWPGNGGELTVAEAEGLAERAARLRLAPVTLTKQEVEGFHEQFCSGVLWPVLHDLVGQLPMHIAGFEIYEAINRRFAEAIVANHRSGDVVWVHDYHLMLVPQLVRERLPEARIGYFLHVPFPGSDLFRVLPFRERLLAGLLGADLIGFHTAGYLRHFAASTLRTLGASMELDRLRWQGREVRAGVFPMGVDVPELERLTDSPGVVQRVREVRGGQAQAIRTLVGIDRLDYTKGLPRRLLAFQTMLRRHPELCGQVKLLQVVLPSRTEVDRYREIRDQVHTLIGRINGDLGTPGWSPVHYIYRSESPEEVVSLYRAADAMLVTPLRDGMNLVAKEFAASRTDEDGVLVLSEFAGAASDLSEALLVNPYDIEGMAQAFHRALVMSAEERRSRIRALRQRVLACDVQRWSRRMLEALCEKGPARAPGVGDLRADPMAGSLERARAARPLVLLLAYDGTLVPFAQTPDLAVPDAEVLDLLETLSARPHTQVHVVSGRCRQSLERWLGGLTVHLHAEHGQWSRPAGGLDTHNRRPRRAGGRGSSAFCRIMPTGRRAHWWTRSQRAWLGTTAPPRPSSEREPETSCGCTCKSC